MYTIKSGNTVLHNVILKDDGYVVEEPKIDEEVNKSSTLTFTVPPTNPAYSTIQKMKSIITVYDDDEEIFRGRVLDDKSDYFKRKQVYCEGELAFLLDSKQRPYSFSGDIPQLLAMYIREHNSQVQDPEKQFLLGNVTVTDPNRYIVRADSEYLSTYESIQKKLIEELGGYIRIRKDGTVRRIDYLKQIGRNDSQIIRFAENILDLSRLVDASNIFTALIPLGAKAEGSETRLTISSVNGGNDYLFNQAAVGQFGWIWQTNTWDDVTVAENLKSKGEAHLQSGLIAETTIELTAFDLHLINADIQRIKCGETVKVISEPHGIDGWMMVSKMTTDLENPENSKMTLGHACKCITDIDK